MQYDAMTRFERSTNSDNYGNKNHKIYGIMEEENGKIFVSGKLQDQRIKRFT